MKRCPYERGYKNGLCNENFCEFWTNGQWIDENWEPGHCDYQKKTEKSCEET